MKSANDLLGDHCHQPRRGHPPESKATPAPSATPTPKTRTERGHRKQDESDDSTAGTDSHTDAYTDADTDSIASDSTAANGGTTTDSPGFTADPIHTAQAPSASTALPSPSGAYRSRADTPSADPDPRSVWVPLAVMAVGGSFGIWQQQRQPEHDGCTRIVGSDPVWYGDTGTGPLQTTNFWCSRTGPTAACSSRAL